MRITSDGKVGIGTVTPGQTLDVWGNLQVKDVNGKVGLLVDPAAGHFHVNQSVASWTNTDQDPVRILGWGWKSGPGNHMFMASGGNDATATQMALMISQAHGFKVGRSAWDGTDSDVSSTAEYFRITNAGNVGINESSPDSKLHISGGSNENITLKLDPGGTAGNYSELVLGRTSSAPTIQTTPVVKGGIPISGVSGILFGSENTNLPAIGFQTPNSSNGHIVFKPKGSEKVRIDSSGRVLIGVLASYANSSIDDLQVGNNNSATQTGITLGSTDESAIAFADAGDARAGSIIYNHGSDHLKIQTGGNNERLRITSAGDVGIGTDNPTGANAVTNNTKTLAVGNIIANDATFKGDVNVEGTLTYEDVTNIDAVGLSTFKDGIHVIGGRESVGIGTTSVDAKLHIEATSGSNLFQLERTSGNNGKLTTTIGGADPCFNIITTGISSDISLRPGAGDGLIGINRSIPWARVDIAGGGTTANRDVPLMVRSGDYGEDREHFRIGRLDTGNTANTYDDIRYHSWWSKNHSTASENYVGIRVHKGSVGASNTQQREVIRFRGDGKVGIGSDYPNSQLDIVRANVSSYPNGNAKPDGASIFNDGGDIFTGRLFLQGWQRSASSDFLTGMNNEGDVLVMYDYGHSKYMQKWHKEAQVELMYNGTQRFRTTDAGVTIYEDTNKVVRFTGGIGEIGDVTGFQATNDANNALVDFGMRATTLRFATGSAERLRITNTGEVNIGGNYTQTTYKMRVTGTVAATHFDSLSDLKLKSNVKQIENPIETVKKIDGVTFNWKEDNEASMGVIAQNVEKVIPELISKDEDDVKSVNYSGLIGLLIETVKEQQKQIDELKSRLDK